MTEVLKIIKHKYDYKVAPELIYNIDKMILDCRKIEVIMILVNFCYRIVNIWNSLPNAVMDVDC